MPANVVRALIVYMLISSFTPGPGNVLALNTMMQYGWRRGKRLLFGIFTGYYGVQLLCAFAAYGLSQVLSSALVWLRYIGAVYLLWLTVHIIRSRPTEGSEGKDPSFWTGCLLQFVNVKIYLYGLTTLSGYILPYYGALWQLVVMEVIIATLGSIATLTWSLAGAKIQRFYTAHYRIVNWIMGAFLLYCAISMLL